MGIIQTFLNPTLRTRPPRLSQVAKRALLHVITSQLDKTSNTMITRFFPLYALIAGGAVLAQEHCAWEKAWCECDGMIDFGTDSRWTSTYAGSTAYAPASGTTGKWCHRGEFGGNDPAVGERKSCRCYSAPATNGWTMVADGSDVYKCNDAGNCWVNGVDNRHNFVSATVPDGLQPQLTAASEFAANTDDGQWTVQGNYAVFSTLTGNIKFLFASSAQLS